MIDIEISLKTIELDLKLPNADEWEKFGLTAAKEIRQRTEKDGKDVQGRTFREYSPYYKNWLAENKPKKNPDFVNLSLSRKMLGALGRGVRPTANGVSIILSGEEGGKAYENEERGREFFGLTEQQAQELTERFVAGIDI